jgi:hypothetical protein
VKHVCVSICVALAVTATPTFAQPKKGKPGAHETSPQAASSDHQELAELYRLDQLERENAATLSREQTDKLNEEDSVRKARALALYQADALKTPGDYFHAAMILQHGKTPEDYLLAHELAMVAAVLGHKGGPWLVAASQDRFLRSLGRNQRFGTQFHRPARDAPWELAPVEPGVTDAVRKLFKVPTLAESKAREKKMNGK